MKYVVLVPDGMAGEPLEELNDLTCMEAAHSPNMDEIAKKGIVGMATNIPAGMTPASDVANLSILGYDPNKYYCGRGPLEAANLGVDIGGNDVAFRFNTVTDTGGSLVDYSAGHITTTEADVLVELLQKELGDDRLSFYPGTSYRHLLVVHCGSADEAKRLSALKCYPPHDIMDKVYSKYLPKEIELVSLMERSKDLLQDNDVNKVRIDLGQNPANMIWVWGQGQKPDMPPFMDAYGISGGMISAVDLLKGLGRILGLKIVDVPGATGYYDTNYEGKAEAALDVLKEKDLVFVHVEAPDEAGHNGDIREKIKAIENFDRKITGRIMKGLSGTDHRILILPDHPTSVKARTHTSEPVPFAIIGKGIAPDDVAVFSEKSARAGSLHTREGWGLMKMLLSFGNK